MGEVSRNKTGLIKQIVHTLHCGKLWQEPHVLLVLFCCFPVFLDHLYKGENQVGRMFLHIRN